MAASLKASANNDNIKSLKTDKAGYSNTYPCIKRPIVFRYH